MGSKGEKAPDFTVCPTFHNFIQKEHILDKKPN
jgi:hypothetical protein